MSAESLSALARGIHYAATSTYAMLAQQYMHMMMQYFDEKEVENEDGKEKRLYAKMAYIEIAENQVVPVPLISLVAPKGLTLDSMKVALSVRIEKTEVKQATIDEDGSGTDRLALQVKLSPRGKAKGGRSSDITDIEMVFKAGDPPEGVMKLIDNITGLVDPINISDPETRKRFEEFQKTYPATPITFKDELKTKKEKLKKIEKDPSQS